MKASKTAVCVVTLVTLFQISYGCLWGCPYSGGYGYDIGISPYSISFDPVANSTSSGTASIALPGYRCPYSRSGYGYGPGCGGGYPGGYNGVDCGMRFDGCDCCCCCCCNTDAAASTDCGSSNDNMLGCNFGYDPCCCFGYGNGCGMGYGPCCSVDYGNGCCMGYNPCFGCSMGYDSYGYNMGCDPSYGCCMGYDPNYGYGMGYDPMYCVGNANGYSMGYDTGYGFGNAMGYDPYYGFGYGSDPSYSLGYGNGVDSNYSLGYGYGSGYCGFPSCGSTSGRCPRCCGNRHRSNLYSSSNVSTDESVTID